MHIKNSGFKLIVERRRWGEAVWYPNNQSHYCGNHNPFLPVSWNCPPCNVGEPWHPKQFNNVSTLLNFQHFRLNLPHHWPVATVELFYNLSGFCQRDGQSFPQVYSPERVCQSGVLSNNIPAWGTPACWSLALRTTGLSFCDCIEVLGRFFLHGGWEHGNWKDQKFYYYKGYLEQWPEGPLCLSCWQMKNLLGNICSGRHLSRQPRDLLDQQKSQQARRTEIAKAKPSI